MRRLALIATVFLVAAQGLGAAGTVVETRSTAFTSNLTARVVQLAWTSDSAGAVSGNTPASVSGQLFQVRFVPGAGGSQPSDQYDVQLLDRYGVDVLATDGTSAGTNLSNAQGSIVLVDPPIFLDNDRIALVVANAGNAKTGRVLLYLK
jgi:hypothetical protein